MPRLSAILVLTTVFHAATLVVQANEHNAACPIPCHHGRCVEVEVGVTYKCDCHEPSSDTMVGFSGPSCDIPYNQCLDCERRCYNNAECKMSDKTPGKYICDCAKAFSISSFAGHECQYSATEVCEAGTPVSDDAFCVNGGRCLATVNKGEDHPGCDCPEEFEGSKCQFLKGTAPEDEGTTFSRGNTRGGSGDEKMNPGLVALIVIVSLGFVGGVAMLIYVKKRDEREQAINVLEGDKKVGVDVSDDMQTSGQSSNGSGEPAAVEDTFANDDKPGPNDLVLEADGSKSFGHDSPIKKEMEEEAKLENGGGDHLADVEEGDAKEIL